MICCILKDVKTFLEESHCENLWLGGRTLSRTSQAPHCFHSSPILTLPNHSEKNLPAGQFLLVMNKEFKIPRCQFWLILNLIMMILATTPWCSKLCLKDWVFNWHAHTVPRSILWNSSHTICSLIYSTIFWVSDFARVITGGVKSHPRAWHSSLLPAQ